MVRSGLQQDVINMYRQGVRNAFSKPQEARPAFLLHLRYNFRVPKLAKRDYTAIEHQLRRMSRTLEMLSSPTVTRLGVSGDMVQWWDQEISQRRELHSSRTNPGPPSSSDTKHNPGEGDIAQAPSRPLSEDKGEPSGGEEVKGGTREGGKEGEGEGEQGLGEGKMPGPGGT